MAEAAPKNGNGRPGGTAKRPAIGTGSHPLVGTAKRPAVGTGSHRPARGGTGGKIALLVVGLVVAAGIGVALNFKDEILGSRPPAGNRTIRPPEVAVRPPEVVVKPPEVVVKPPEVVKPPVPPPPVTPDNGAAEKAIAEGRGLLAQINYDGARKAFGRVETMKVSPELARQAGALGRKAEAFGKLTRDVKVRADANQTISVVELTDGKKVRGVVTRKPDGGYSVLAGTAGGGQMTYTFAAAEVRDLKEVDPAERRAELKKALNTRLARLGAAAAPPELFDAAVFAIENGLGEDSLPILEKAWDGAEALNKDLVLLVAESQAGRFLSQAIWSDSIGQESYARRYCEKILTNGMYKSTGAYADAEKMLALMDARKGIKGGYVETVKVTGALATNPDTKPPPAPEPTATPVVEPPRPAPTVTVARVTSKADVGEANRLFEEGLKYYFKAMPGMADCKANQAEARTRLRKAQELYEAAVKADPDNSQLQSRLTDCNMRLYGIMKMSTL